MLSPATGLVVTVIPEKC